jgi:hypothetical protein
MSRHQREEMPFGSDSFLDVLANIVGILIILIVAAASRMGRVPDPVLLSQTVPETVQKQDLPPSPPTEAAEPVPVPEPEHELARSDPETDEPPPGLNQELEAISRRLLVLEAKTPVADDKLKKLRSAHQSALEKLKETDQDSAKQTDALREAQLRVARLEESLGERKEALNGILAEFEEAQKATPQAVEVKHRLAPISQEIVGEEMHFRLAEGRVSVVPLQPLIDRVIRQMKRQQDWLASRGKHEAVVGPVDGYSMQYVVEKQSLSVLDRSRLGYGAYRIGVTHADIVPERDLAAETPEQALRRGSRFSTAVKTAPAKAALTFWVYPDSFHAFRILQAACQAEGFIVAARPLPEGHLIGVAPNGSRSAGQ